MTPEEHEAWLPSKAVEELTVRRALADVEDPVKLANQLLRDALPLAVMGMTHMAVHETNAHIRFNAQKYVIDRSMGGTSAKAMPIEDKPAWERIFDNVAVQSAGSDEE